MVVDIINSRIIHDKKKERRFYSPLFFIALFVLQFCVDAYSMNPNVKGQVRVNPPAIATKYDIVLIPSGSEYTGCFISSMCILKKFGLININDNIVNIISGISIIFGIFL